MNGLTAIITTILLGAAIGYNASTAQPDNQTFIGPPPTAESGDTIEPGGPPPTFDEGDTPLCLSCG
jgi:hypothetical protein